MAEISHYADIVHVSTIILHLYTLIMKYIFILFQISYVSSSPILSDRSRFQSFWRTYPSDASVNPAVLAVVKQYGWRKVKVITQDETLFVEVLLALCIYETVIGAFPSLIATKP